ncbi:hypothetical protein OSB04_016688 [Centaurea solstitialis]|uniref:CCHC-type domain-containing protein n=1 Tax=Centaurea solstitialis TaxID=347529 RepID=A0AA38T1F9_9ASTR|nr:hypothetical protein OSB04_016688 [Centaurea solstitialis]
MASTVTSTNNLSLRSILEKDKLTGPNFLDWERNLMIVLRHERKWYVLEEPLGEAPPANAPAAARNAHKKHSDDLLDVASEDMFQTQARTERYDATKAFNECKMIKGTSVSDHVMKMKWHLDHLERLGHPVPLQLATDTILNSLSDDYKPFVVNYNMNNMEKSIAELHSMLKTAELNMGTKNKTKDVLMSAPKVHNKGKGKGKGKKLKPNKARTENRCFTCNEVGHWRQNCPKRHEAEVIVLTLKYLFYDQLLNNSYKCCRPKVAQASCCPPLRKSEVEYYAMLVGVHHYNGRSSIINLSDDIIKKATPPPTAKAAGCLEDESHVFRGLSDIDSSNNEGVDTEEETEQQTEEDTEPFKLRQGVNDFFDMPPLLPTQDFLATNNEVVPYRRSQRVKNGQVFDMKEQMIIAVGQKFLEEHFEHKTNRSCRKRTYDALLTVTSTVSFLIDHRKSSVTGYLACS